MLAISPEYCSYGWVMNDEENLRYFCRERSESSGGNSKNGDGDGDKKVKKLNHNASERDRRKKMNTLYANLRSLLPHQDHSKKLSIPATISRVLKYIPELQREVERLSERKERFISTDQFKKRSPNNSAAASATRITDAEAVIQISMPKSDKCWLSEAILRLEEEGFVVVNASCFESFQGRLFYNLHFQAQQGQVIDDAQQLKERVWALI
ncbi:ribonuclease Z [Salvia divinorum]|uniref:Ribonuclease Z n=1 Tax=Salvia divinorum TaxID=28513 RepID=A0ABD1GX55_SALDI